MTLNSYMRQALDTVCYDDSLNAYYTALGLCEESGEVAGKLKKAWRDVNIDVKMVVDIKNKITPEVKKGIMKEMGDVLWYLAKMCDDLDCELNDVAQMNLDKIHDRKERDVLHGEGDDR